MDAARDEGGARRLIGRASIAAAGTLYQQGISFLSGLVVARVIGASDYGIFNLARNLVDLAGTLTRLGLDVGLQRHFGEARALASRVTVLRRVRLLSGAFAVLMALAVALGLGEALEAHVYRYAHFGDILLFMALGLPFLTDLTVLGGAYRGILKLAPTVVAESVLLPTIRLAVTVILFLAGWRLWAVVVGSTLATLLGWAFLAARARSDFRGDGVADVRPWPEALKVLRYSSVLAMAVLVTTLTNSMDILMLGRFTTSQDLGEYSLVKTLLTLMGVFGVAFGQGLGALVAERHFRGDFAGMVRVIALSARLIALATTPIFAIFFFWGAQITHLFGPTFAVSQTVVAWLASAQFIFMIFGPCGWALSMTGKHVLELRILSIGLVVAALASWIAVPAYGQLGAAVAACAATGTANVARALFVRRAVGSFPLGGDVFAIAATGVMLAWGVKWMVSELSLSSLWSTLFGISGFLLVYAAAGWSFLLSRSERIGIHGTVGSTARILLSRGA